MYATQSQYAGIRWVNLYFYEKKYQKDKELILRKWKFVWMSLPSREHTLIVGLKCN